ncbi:MAG: hypothetical protein ACI9Z4_000646, partial [Polaribacter sp.]
MTHFVKNVTFLIKENPVKIFFYRVFLFFRYNYSSSGSGNFLFNFLLNLIHF